MKSGSRRVESVEIEAFEQRQLLQHHRTLSPRSGLAHGVAAIVVSQRRFDGRRPARHVVAGKHTAMPRTAGVHDLLGAAETVDGVGDEALRPGFARPLNLSNAIATAAFGFLEDAQIRFRKRLVDE